MPSLVLSSRYTVDSQVLRQRASSLDWEILRLDGEQLPDWFDPPDKEIAFYFTPPRAFEIAAQLSRVLLGCPTNWTVTLPQEFLLRRLEQMTLAAALARPGRNFVKHAISKAFPAGIYDAAQLAEATSRVSPQALVHVGEPVEWLVEYRCFVIDRTIATMSPYRRYGQIFDDALGSLGEPIEERDAAARFAQTVLNSSAIPCPPAFVLDIGLIKDRGWAVVECNECWASGVYYCDLEGVLSALLRACVPEDSRELVRWNFRRHYEEACPGP